VLKERISSALPNRLLPRWEARPWDVGKIRRRGRALAALAAAIPLLLPAPGESQTAGQNRISIIRDAEVEALIQDYARPLFKAAGIRPQAIEIFVVPDPTFNAFVATNRSMFINIGALLDSKTPNEIIGVIAHETGHLANAHLVRMQQMMRNVSTASMIAGVIAMGAIVAGAQSNPGLGDSAGGVMAGIGEAAKRDILSYARGIEMEADRAGLSYLEATGQSGEGMLITFRRLADDTLLLARDANPYLLSHPLPRERIALLESAVAKSKYRTKKDPPALQRRHDLMRAKLSGFSESRERVARRYPASDTSLPARYARAILAYRFDGAARAAPLIDALIHADPDNPYFWELKGQSYLEAGRPRNAIPPLRKAVALASAQGSQSGLLRILLGQALVDSGDASLTDEAIKNLNVGLLADPAASTGYRTLARAYAAKGDIGQAQLATAQGLLAEGKVEEAKIQAKRAQAKLKEGSPAWLRADDIVAYKPPPKSGVGLQ